MSIHISQIKKIGVNIFAKQIFFPLLFLLFLILIPTEIKSAVTLQTTNTPSVGVDTNGCYRFSRNLSYGKRDGLNQDVTALQKFLVSRGYLSSGLASGYFGKATLKAVRSYQSDAGLASFGYVGELTRISIESKTCGSDSTNVNYNNIQIDPNIINNSTISNPDQGVTYISNSVDTTSIDNGKIPYIKSLSPDYGDVGDVITLYGNDFDPANNTVVLGGIAINNLKATGTLQFVIPQLRPSCPEFSSSGCTVSTAANPFQNGNTYQLYVINSHGRTSNIRNFNIGRNRNNIRPSIRDSYGPANLRLNENGIWTLFVQDAGKSVTVRISWGDESTKGSYSGGKTFNVKAGDNMMVLTHNYDVAGDYNITFRAYDDDSGLDTSKTVKVHVASNVVSDLSKISIWRLVAQSWLPGDQIQLYGNGFSLSDNTVYFDKGFISGLPSYNNGTLILFNIPKYINPCDTIISGNCTANVIRVATSTRYDVSVSNSYGRRSNVTSLTTGR